MPHRRYSSDPEQQHVCGGSGGGSVGRNRSKDGAEGMENALNAVGMVDQTWTWDANGSERERDANGSPPSSPLSRHARTFLPSNQKADDPEVIDKFLLGTHSQKTVLKYFLYSKYARALTFENFR